jgi:hypothetical protein
MTLTVRDPEPPIVHAQMYWRSPRRPEAVTQQLRQLGQRVHRPGGLPVDQGNGQAVSGDDVPRGHLAMPDDLVGALRARL